jgi:hypothetical protein
MNELLLIFIYFVGIVQGLVFGFIQWAPDSAFKQGFVDGITFKFLWGRK